MLLTNNKMLKGLNRFHGSVDSKKKADMIALQSMIFTKLENMRLNIRKYLKG